MRICGVNLRSKKRLIISLTDIKGIGNTTAAKIIKAMNLDESIRTEQVSDEKAQEIEAYILAKSDAGEILYGPNLINEVNNRKKMYISMRTRRGDRHQRHLPVRGQRTKSNSRTVRLGKSTRSKAV